MPALAAFVLASIATLTACGASVQTTVPPGTDLPSNYPLTIVDSPEHRDAMKAEWNRLFDAYGVPSERRKIPDLTPVLHTPHSILGTGPIRLGSTATGKLEDSEIRLLLRKFIADYAQLLGVVPATLSLESVETIGGIGSRYTFRQNSFSYPIAPPAGQLDFMVSPSGELVQMSVTSIPRADLPEPRLTRANAAERILGSTFTYGDKAGRPQSVTITDPGDINVKRMVVYPQETESAVAIRLCWEIEAGNGMTWTVYVDAVTGQTVGTIQNFQT